MRFIFPDSQDQIDPYFNFDTEQHLATRVRQRDDRYAHEILGRGTFSGILASKAIVVGYGNCGGRYTMGQRNRLFRVGIREFFRLDKSGNDRLEAMGDCGAFSYVREDYPPWSSEQVLNFYHDLGFDSGVAPDHVILNYDAECDNCFEAIDTVPAEWRERQAITLEFAAEFFSIHQQRRCRFQPIGVAQGWSPGSYALSVTELQRIGFRRIAMGGMVPLKTPQILDTLRAVKDVKEADVELHLFGVTRTEHVADFASYGVTSFDSTAPFRRAFKDSRNNFYTPAKTYMAVRVPQVDGNQKLRRRIRAGEIDQQKALELEGKCLDLVKKYDIDDAELDNVVDALREYEELYDGKVNRSKQYREVLGARPWKACDCAICREVGIQVILFRGSERNKRRGFHNLYVFAQNLQNELAGKN